MQKIASQIPAEELSRTLYVGGVPHTHAQPPDAFEANVRSWFEEFGAIEQCFLRYKDEGEFGPCRSYCLVTFDTAVAKLAALEAQKTVTRTADSPPEDVVELDIRQPKRSVFRARSLFLFQSDNRFRMAAVAVVHNPYFDSVILLVIVLNAMMMAMEDPLNPGDTSMDGLELFCNVVFTAELMLKVLSHGFVLGKGTYLRSGWNQLDFVVVVSAWLPYMFDDMATTNGLRILRVLRPLRTISRFPGLKHLVVTIFMAAPQLQLLLIVVFMFFVTFGIIAVQMWKGVFRQRCDAPSFSESCHDPTTVNATVSFLSDLCPCEYSMHGCAGAFCDLLQPACPADSVCTVTETNPYYDWVSFDNIISSWIVVLQCITTTSWQEVMHIAQATAGLGTTAWFLACVVLGGFFLLNLFVAVLKEKFGIAQAVLAVGENLFQEFDTDGSGLLDIDEVSLLFGNRGVVLSADELATCWADMDDDGSGAIDEQEFMAWLRSDERLPTQMRKRLDVAQRALEDQDTKQSETFAKMLDMSTPIEERARLKLLSMVSPGTDWVALFHFHAPDDTNELFFRQFKAMLRRDGGITPSMMSNEEVQIVFEAVDVDSGGTVDAEEFSTWLQPEPIISPDKVASQDCEDEIPASEKSVQFFEEVLPPWQQAMQDLTTHRFFTALFMVLIIINIVVLSWDHYGIDTETYNLLEDINTTLTVMFAMELLLKMAALQRRFIDDLFNVFDAFVVVTGLIELAYKSNSMSAFRIFRMFRLLRVLRLISFLKPLRTIFRVVVETTIGLGYISALLFLFMFIFSVFGMQIFGGKFFFEHQERPQWNFDTFPVAMMTAFQILTYDMWSFVLIDGMRAVGWSGAFYFFFWITIGALVLRNLLLVIILETYVIVRAQTLKEEQAEDAVHDAESRRTWLASMPLFEPLKENVEFLSAVAATLEPRMVHANEMVVRKGGKGTAEMYFITKGAVDVLDSLTRPAFSTLREGEFFGEGGLFADGDVACGTFVRATNNPLNLYVLKKSSLDEAFKKFPGVEETVQEAWVAIKLAYEEAANARLDSLSPKSRASLDSTGSSQVDLNTPQSAMVAIADSDLTERAVMLCIFLSCITMSMETPDVDPDSDLGKTLWAFGLVFTLIFTFEAAIKMLAHGVLEPKDTAYLADGWNRLDFTILLVAWMDLLFASSGIGAFKALRALRALRVLNKIKGLRILVLSLLDATSALGNVGGLTAIMWLIFGICGVNYLKGMFWRCNSTDDMVAGIDTCVGVFAGVDGIVQQRRWENAPANFDHIGSAMFALFEVSMGEWHNIAHDAIDSVGVGQQPVQGNSPIWTVYFIFFVVLSNLFFLNLFVGVIYEKYHARKYDGIEELSKEQLSFLSVVKMITSSQFNAQRVLVISEQEGLRGFCHRIVSHPFFDQVILMCIALNCTLMACTFMGEPMWWEQTQYWLNHFFTILFTGEAVAKIIAFGLRQYWFDPWNRFDFVVVIVSWLDVIVTLLDIKYFSASLFRIIRIARVVGRVGRLSKSVKVLSGIDSIVNTFLGSLPALGYIFLFIGLLVFIFAIVAMSLFGKIKFNGCLNEFRNFRTVPRAMLTLFGMGTKDSAVCLVHACMVAEPDCSMELGDCGDSRNAELFFVLFDFTIMVTTIESEFHRVLSAVCLAPLAYPVRCIQCLST